MNDSVRRAGAIRPSDVVLTVLLAGLGVALMVENMTDHHASIRIDSHSWLLLPVWLLAVAPVLVWRRSPLLAVVVAAAVMGAHVLAFGWVGRCGSGLPLTWVLAYLVGTRDTLRRSLAALAAVEVLGALVLVHDSAAGPSLIPVVAVLSVGIWGIGRVVHQRTAMAAELERRNEELAQLRDARASLDVADDRARLSAELDTLLDLRLEQLGAAAEAGRRSTDTGTTHDLLVRLEEDSRRVLAQMREMVGELRGGEVALAPAPSVAQLEALLARHAAGSHVVVSGSPHSLPASVELSAYRLVEHLLEVLADDPTAPVEVRMAFEPDSLGISLSGRVARGADVRGALARARERIRLQHGSLDVRVTRGRARVTAQLPVAA